MYSGGELGIQMYSEGELGIRSYLSGLLVSTSDLFGPPIPSEDVVDWSSFATIIYQSAEGEWTLVERRSWATDSPPLKNLVWRRGRRVIKSHQLLR